jgi:hypothetical protein
VDRNTGLSTSPGSAPVPPELFTRKRLGPTAEGGVDALVTLAGTVEQGVESSSVVLLDEAGSPLAQLNGRPAADYPLGIRVEVTGRFVTGLRTTAQQGRPFRVEEMKVL